MMSFTISHIQTYWRAYNYVILEIVLYMKLAGSVSVDELKLNKPVGIA